MKIKTLKQIGLALAGFGLLLPTSGIASAAEAQRQLAVQQAQPVIADIALASGGRLHGQVVDEQGVAKSNTQVSIQHQGQEVARTTTDREGVFQVDGLRGGVHVITTENTVNVYRLWAPQTAPPAASQGVLFVNDGITQRANFGNVIRNYGLGAVLVVGGAAAIVAVAADQGPSS